MPVVHTYVRRYISVPVKELVSQIHVQCDPMHLHPKCILHIIAVMGLQLKPGVARVDSVIPSTGVSLFTQESYVVVSHTGMCSMLQ